MMNIRQRNDDPLAELLNSAAEASGQQVTPPASYQPQTFEERCKKCGGSGRFTRGRFSGQCFACKGTGKKVFATTPEARQQASAGRARRSAQSAETNLHVFSLAHPEVWAWMDGNAFDFAVAMKQAIGRFGSLTEKQLAACERLVAKRNAATAAAQARVDNAATVSMDKLTAAFDAARANGAKRKVRMVGLTFSEAKTTSKNPGAIYVKDGTRYLGKVMDSKFVASRECTDAENQLVIDVAADPRAAAIAYGRKTGSCACCGRELTDPVSVDMGIGPICATKWGW